MKIALKNQRMLELLRSLQPLLSRRDKLGYVAARNSRFLSDSLTEYESTRRSLLEKYGEEEIDENGVPILRLSVESPNFKAFCDELQPFSEISHEVELMKVKYGEVIGLISGEEILAIDWMLED